MKKSDKGSKLKKQLVSGGIYIALAAAVVTVTLNGVNSIIGSENDIEIPEIDTNIPDIKLELPEMNLEDNIFNDKNYHENDLGKNNKTEIEKNVTVSDSPEGINDIVVAEKSENDSVSYENSNTEKSDLKPNTEPGQDENNKSEQLSETDVEYPTEPEPVFYGIFAKPADGYVDREFTTDTLVYSPTMGDFRTHNGIDITGELASPVRAICDGVVDDVYYDDFYGHTVSIDHGNGIKALYMNLSEEIPKEIQKGTTVKIGQIIGGIGQSASFESADVSHLHLSIMRNGEYIDPSKFLRQQ